MKPFKFSNANLVLTRPKDMTDDQCGSLSAFTDTEKMVGPDGEIHEVPFVIVGFTPTKKDIEAMQIGMPIQIKFTGETIQPMSIYTQNLDGSINPEEEEVKHICPSGNPESICEDCPQTGCYYDKTDLGICKEKGCTNFATSDYNGKGHYVCKDHLDSLSNYFDEEYR